MKFAMSTPMIKIIGVVMMMVTSAMAHSSHDEIRAEDNLSYDGESVDGVISLRLMMLNKSMFRDEKPWLAYEIRNVGDTVALLTNQVIGKRNSGIVQDAQLWFQFENENGCKWDFHPEIGRNWNRLVGDKGNVSPLAPGGFVTGTTRRGSSFDNESALGHRKVRAALLVGDNQYAFSNWCDINVVDKSLEDGAKLIEVDYGSTRSKAPMYINEIDGERWAFIAGYRIFKLPEGVTPEFETDRGTAVMTIRFPGSGCEPVKHNVRMMDTLSGPCDLVPHLYLADAFKEPIVNSVGLNEPKGDMRENRVETEAIPTAAHSPKWLWLCVGVLVAIVLLIIFRSSK